jgi:hypothetical protein
MSRGTSSDVAPTRRLRLTLAAVGLAVFAACAAGTWARATYNARLTADEPQYLLTAISLADDLDLDVADERAALRYLPFHQVGLPIQGTIQSDGSQINPHDPLLPVVLALPMAIGGWLAAKLTMAAIAGALAALLVWTAVRRLDVPLLATSVVVLAFALSPPLAVYGTQIYPELPAALAVTVAVAALLGRPRLALAVVAGVALVALPWLSAKHAMVGLAIAGAGAWRWWRPDRRAALALLGVLAAGGVVYLAFSQAVYGGWTPYAVGSHFLDGELTVVGRDVDVVSRSTRVEALLTSRTAGLVAWAPVWLLLVPALAACLRRRPSGWPLLAVPLAAGWFVATFVAETLHGWEWPGRQVLAVLPLGVLAVAWWVGRVQLPARPWMLVVTAALGLAGAVIYGFVVVEATVRRIALVVDADRTIAPVYRLLHPLMPDYRVTDGGLWARHGLWLAVLVGLGALGWRSAAPRPVVVPAPELAARVPV